MTRIGRATSYDVARLAGVAQSTVSRGLAGDAGISDDTRRRVREAAEHLGYTPNALARSLIRQRSDLVAVLVARYTLRAAPDLLHAVGETLAAAGKRVMLVTLEGDRPEPDALRSVLEYPLDGLVSCVLLDPTVLGSARRRCPVVFLNRDPGPGTADCVFADHAAAAGRLARVMHRAGHRRFLCLRGPPGAFVGTERADGFLRALAALGTERWAADTDYTYAQGRHEFLRHAAERGLPDAVFCANDRIALGVIDACRYELGLDLPADLSVVGFDDVAEAAYAPYRLTTFSQDPVRLAREAVQLLLHRIAHPAAPVTRRVIPATLVHRGSARLEPA